ncbi:hypothetical protein TWF696_009424 [Orbilia brochopaga]|uniref:F-box domain-containing protein n=1 Tax=Orbilia brochopaga TaxID=3140254 RepID=A0AAV9UC45_9PEZI
MAMQNMDPEPSNVNGRRPSPVFTIPEVITLILTHVPPVELLASSRRVCRTWKAAVDTSPVLRWRTWTNNPAATIPSSIRDAQLCVNSNSCTFELNPLALHFVQRIWRQHMSVVRKARPYPTASARIGRIGNDQLAPMATATASSPDACTCTAAPQPSRNLLRPADRTKNIWIYAGGGSGGGVDMDILKYHYNHAGSCVSIDALVNTLLEGHRRAERVSANLSVFDIPGDEEEEEEEANYYSLIIHAFAEPRDGTDTTIKDTEIRIKLQLFEPFSIAGVSEGTEILSRHVRYVGGSGRGIMTADPWKDLKHALGTGAHQMPFNGPPFLA